MLNAQMRIQVPNAKASLKFRFEMPFLLSRRRTCLGIRLLLSSFVDVCSPVSVPFAVGAVWWKVTVKLMLTPKCKNENTALNDNSCYKSTESTTKVPQKYHKVQNQTVIRKKQFWMTAVATKVPKVLRKYHRIQNQAAKRKRSFESQQLLQKYQKYSKVL